MLNVSVSPHLRAETDTPALMRDVAIALLPACIFGVYNNGYRAAVIILISVATALLTEFLFEKLVRRTVTVGDWSAVVTGLLLAVNLPASVPYWMPALGSLFAILVVKQLFGGIGQNFMNPALAGRCFLLISFTAEMTSFTYDGVSYVNTPVNPVRAYKYTFDADPYTLNKDVYYVVTGDVLWSVTAYGDTANWNPSYSLTDATGTVVVTKDGVSADGKTLNMHITLGTVNADKDITLTLIP